MDPDIKSVLDKDTLESIFANVKFLDTDNGTRDNTLIDPLKTVEVGLEDVEVPAEYELKTVGAGPNQRDIIVKKDRPKGINRFLAGFIGDAILGRDWDRQGGVRGDWAAESPITGYGAEWDDATKQKILEREGEADLSGNALPDAKEQKKILEWQNRQAENARVNRIKDVQLNSALNSGIFEDYQQTALPWLQEAMDRNQRSPYVKTVLRGKAGDLSASMKQATAQQLYNATLAAQAGLQPRGIRYANTA